MGCCWLNAAVAPDLDLWDFLSNPHIVNTLFKQKGAGQKRSLPSAMLCSFRKEKKKKFPNALSKWNYATCLPSLLNPVTGKEDWDYHGCLIPISSPGPERGLDPTESSADHPNI